METRANHFVIGLFVLALVASGFTFLYWLKHFGAGTGSKRYAVLFDGPVNGVVRGSNVLFNGVRVGQVRALSIDSVDTTRVRVVLDVAGTTPVRTDSRARITQQGLTGVGAIQISAGSRDAEIVPTSARNVALIATDRGGATSLFDAAPKVLGNADTAINSLNEILRTNAAPIARTIRNIETVSDVLAANKANISGLLTDVRGLTTKFAQIEPLLDNTNALVKRLDAVVGQNEKRINRTLDNVEVFSKELAANRGEMTAIVKNVKSVTENLKGTGKFLQTATAVISRVDRLVDSNEAGITSAVTNVQAFTKALDRNTTQVDGIFRDIKTLSGQLKIVATKMETTLDDVGSFLKSENGESIVTEARTAITSFRKLAQQLEGSVGANAAQLTRSTQRSLAELELFMRDGRRLTRNLDRVLDGIDRNPQRLLFGGSTVPEYNPQ